MSKYFLNYLDELESEAVFVMREVWAQFQNPVILFSGGKDSIVLTHLAKKAFYPSKIPFPLMHIDTGHNFPETMKFRDDLVEELRTRMDMPQGDLLAAARWERNLREELRNAREETRRGLQRLNEDRKNFNQRMAESRKPESS